MSYYEQLRDPRWQQKRLLIMQRDKFKCRSCGSTEKTLAVHHRRYIKGKKPWEYDSCDLVTLCEECHTRAELFLDATRRLLGEFSENNDHHQILIGFLEGYCLAAKKTGFIDFNNLGVDFEGRLIDQEADVRCRLEGIQLGLSCAYISMNDIWELLCGTAGFLNWTDILEIERDETEKQMMSAGFTREEINNCLKRKDKLPA